MKPVLPEEIETIQQVEAEAEDEVLINQIEDESGEGELTVAALPKRELE